MISLFENEGLQVDQHNSRNWEDWVGRSSTSSTILDPAQANRMAATLDREAAFEVGDELPPAWHWLYFHDIVRSSQLGLDGHPELGVVMPPVPLDRRMWAAGEIAFDRPLRLGDTVTRVSIIRSITPKHGRSGPLYFVDIDHSLETGAEVAVRETQTIVYRELSAEVRTAGSQARTDGEFEKRWRLDSTALFRYSALTFNGHRIHYDVDYARDVERYPGLVIHGPLLATLLADLAVGRGKHLATFRYQARSPLFVPEEFSVAGREEDGKTSLWVASDDGRLAMDAHATYTEEVAS